MFKTINKPPVVALDNTLNGMSLSEALSYLDGLGNGVFTFTLDSNTLRSWGLPTASAIITFTQYSSNSARIDCVLYKSFDKTYSIGKLSGVWSTSWTEITHDTTTIPFPVSGGVTDVLPFATSLLREVA